MCNTKYRQVAHGEPHQAHAYPRREQPFQAPVQNELLGPAQGVCKVPASGRGRHVDVNGCPVQGRNSLLLARRDEHLQQVNVVGCQRLLRWWHNIRWLTPLVVLFTLRLHKTGGGRGALSQHAIPCTTTAAAAVSSKQNGANALQRVNRSPAPCEAALIAGLDVCPRERLQCWPARSHATSCSKCHHRFCLDTLWAAVTGGSTRHRRTAMVSSCFSTRLPS